MNNTVIYVAVAAILAALVGSVVKNNAMLRARISNITKKVSVVAVAFMCMFATACGTAENEEANDTPEQNIEDTTKEDETEQETPEENVEEETNTEDETSKEEEQKQEETAKNEKDTKVKEETPKKEEAKKEAPKKEEPKKEETKKEAPKKEEPKKEAPKQEAPKQEAPKQEAPKKEEPAPAPAPEVKSKYKNGTFSGTADGFQGPITVNVTINNDQITGISVASHSEDDPFWSDAKKVIDSIISAQSTSVNAISGATFSSNGIKQAVGAALNSAKN